MAEHCRIARRPVLAAVGALAASVALPGCALPPSDPFDRRGPITLVDGPDTSFNRQIAQLVDEWNKIRDADEKVTFTEMPYATDEFRAQIRAQAQDLAQGNRFDLQPQCYDVLTMDVIWTAEFARAGYLVPLDAAEFGMNRFLRKPVEAVTVDGRVYAVPQRTDAGLLFYRKDLLLDTDLRRPPLTWDEMIAQAQMVVRKHGVHGYIGQFKRYEGLTVNAVEAVWANGGDVLTTDGDVVVNSPAAEAGITMLARGFVDGWIPRDALEFDEERSRESFQQGYALFLRNWPYVHPKLGDPASPVHDKFGVTALPGPSALGGWNLGVSSCSTHRRTAREFIKFVTNESNQRRLFESGGFAPTIAALYDDTSLRKQFPYLDLLRSSVESSRIRPATARYEEVSDAIQEHVTNALSNPLSAEHETDRLAERLTDIVSPH